MEIAPKEVLRIEKLSKVYGIGSVEVRAVDNVDLTANRSEIVLIMGPSGSGKTTLITIAGALLKPTSGSVYLDNQNIVTLPEKNRIWIRRSKIGFVFQSFNLLANLTTFENVFVPLGLSGVKRQIAKKKVEGLLEVFGLGNRANFTPERLSGGEKQRVSIARALANDPKLILADEPTANLDSQRGREVMRLLRSVAKNLGKTVLIVSHDQRLIEIADRVLWMEDGRIQEQTDLQTDPTCGSSVEAKSTTPSVSYRGKTTYFCSKECRKEFIEKNHLPASYY